MPSRCWSATTISEVRVTDCSRDGLTDGGRFVFETRDPLVRAWERWTPEDAVEKTDPTGNVVRMALDEVETPVTGDGSLHHHIQQPGLGSSSAESEHSEVPGCRSPREHLSAADLVIEEQFGDWVRTFHEDEPGNHHVRPPSLTLLPPVL